MLTTKPHHLTKLELALIIEEELNLNEGKTMVMFIAALASRIHWEQEKKEGINDSDNHHLRSMRGTLLLPIAGEEAPEVRTVQGGGSK